VLDKLIAPIVRAHARRVYERFRADAQNARAVQDRLLQSLIRDSQDSDFGRAHRFADIKTYDDFIERVPILPYEYLAPWVEKVMAGDTGAMFGRHRRVHMFAMTSGTVGKPKFVPVTDRFIRDQRDGWNTFGIKALLDHPSAILKPILQITSPMDEQRTSSGTCCGAITGLMAANQKRLVRKYYVAPLPVAYIPDTLARRYTIMRLAMPADVGWIVTASPATVLQLAKIGESHAEDLIRDIRDGTLSDSMEIPDSVRDALKPRLSPDAKSANKLARLRESSGTLRPHQYWNLGFLANWTGGTMGLHLNEFPKYFGDTPVRDIGLIATEGRMSIPFDDRTPAGACTVSSVFFEFVPAEEYGRENPTVLRIHEVEAGRDYFILITTSAGFYRYDICDCVRVVGFLGQSPMIEFLHKGAHVSSLTGEKITEQQVVLAFDRAIRDQGLSASSFVLAPRWDEPPYYQLYIESGRDQSGGFDTANQFVHLARSFDEHLSKLNIEYASKRKSDRLKIVQVAIVPHGTFARMDNDRATRHRRANEQFKHQYLLAQVNEDSELSALVENGATRFVSQPTK
jgi:GH3 auxin-responsive promoter